MLDEAAKKFIREHLEDDIHKLALHSQSGNTPELDIPFLLNQINWRNKSKNKLPTWYANENIIYPSSVSLEQCSSEQTARYKTFLINGRTFVDLTGGFGVDTSFLSKKFEKGIYVEKQEKLVEIARHNLKALGICNVDVIHSDAIDFLEGSSVVDCIFIDPSRRSDTGKKVMLIQDCEPDLVRIQGRLQEKADKVLVKLSPMLDLKSVLKDIRHVKEVHIVSVNNDCKELLLLIDKNHLKEPVITCVNFQADKYQSDSFSYSEEAAISPVLTGEVKTYLYELNSSAMKAGFYKSIARKYHVEKLDKNSHLYTSMELVSDFPGRIFKVITTSSFNKKDLKFFLSDVEKANISVRNFPLSVDELRKKIRIKEGGELYLFATTLTGGRRILIKTCQLFSFD